MRGYPRVRCAMRRVDPRALVLLGLIAVLAMACGSSPIRAGAIPHTDASTAADLDRVLAGPQRSPENRARDAHRHPKETLEFFGLAPNQTVVEVWPSRGWYTEILAPLLKDHGHYIAAGLDPNRSPEPSSVRLFAEKLAANPSVYDRVTVTALENPTALAPVPPGSVDLALTFRNLHNWLAQDGAVPVLKALYDALKPGGYLGVEDHRAIPAAPVDPRARLGYVNEQYAIELIKSVGFEFAGSSEINSNEKDTKDYEQGVWTLPPTYRLGEKDRARYAAIGESDRFTLLFRKPGG